MILEKLQQTKLILEHTETVIFRWKNQEHWPVCLVTRNVEKLCGYDEQDFLSAKIFYEQLVHPDDRQRVYQEVQNMLARKETKFFKQQYRIITKSGDSKWLQDETHIIRNNAGEVLFLEGLVHDISDIKNLELDLQAHLNELRCLYQIAEDMQNPHLDAAAICHRLINHLQLSLQHPESAQVQLSCMQHIYGAKEVPEGLPHLYAEFSIDKFSIALTVFYGEGKYRFRLPQEQAFLNTVVRQLALWLQSEDARQCKEKIAKQKKLLLDLYQQVPLMSEKDFYAFTLAELLTLSQSQAIAMYGLEEENYRQINSQYLDKKFIFPDFLAKTLVENWLDHSSLGSYLSSITPVPDWLAPNIFHLVIPIFWDHRLHFLLILAGKSHAYEEADYHLVQLMMKEALKLFTHQQDIEKLRQLAAVFQNTSEGISITDLRPEILDVNPAYEKITGYSRAEVLHKNPNVLKSGHQDEAFYRTHLTSKEPYDNEKEE